MSVQCPNASLFFLVLFLVPFLRFIPCHSQKLSPNPRPDFPCKTPQHSSYPFCNTSLPNPTRAHSLISLLTLQEKIQQLSNNASSIPRLGIPAYEWWSESLHGIATNGPGITFNGPIPSATIFPQVIVTAASFNRTLWSAIASAIAIEARAMYNVGQAGLTFWAPNINIFRDPRWGRGQETPGEDPMVASAFAIEYVRAIQGEKYRRVDNGSGALEFGEKRVLRGDGEEEDNGLMLSACCKHLTAYDLEKWEQFARYNFNAVVTNQDMEDTYLPPFRSCIEQAQATCLMCSYNRVNGIPACARHDLLQKARTDWGFNGYITSDCDAVATIYEDNHYTDSPADAVAVALKAGTDINCGTYMKRHTQAAIEQGKVEESDIDKALFNLFMIQLRLGLFDGDPKQGIFGKLGPQDVCTSAHKALALVAARQGIVLLKNEKKFLPLDKNGVSSLAIIGPMANDSIKLGGDYTGVPCSPKSILEGLGAYVKRIYYSAGCLDVPCNNNSGFAEAISVAKEADVVVVVAGLDLSQETEDHDRYSLLLPGEQMALVTAVAAVSKNPSVLVLAGGGPLDVSFAKEDSRIASILWIGYPGENGGEALAGIIFGDYNPDSFTRVPMTDMRMRADPSRNYPGRTYRFYIGEEVYGFGHGLSYTNYMYKIVSAPNKLSLFGAIKAESGKNILHQRRQGLHYVHIDEVEYCDSLKFSIRVSVMNSGDMDGSPVVMLFSKVPKSFVGAPLKQLIGFDRVRSSPYGPTETSILVDPCLHLGFANEDGTRILPLGDHSLILEDLEHIVSVEI